MSSVGNRSFALVSQLVVAWFLIPDQLGLAAIAYSIANVGTLLFGNGVRDVLVQRRDRFRRDASEGFWLALAMNVTAAALLFLVAPLIGIVFRDPRVVPLVMILATSWPVISLSTVYIASLYRDLRFRTLASIRFGQGLISGVGTMVLAICGFGAYSLVLPVVAREIFATAAARLAAGRVPIGRPHPRLWPAILLPALWLMFHAFLWGVQYYGPSFVIGLVCGSALTGIYFWGFQVSSQALIILSINLREVFFPTLTRLNGDAERQYRGFRKACRTLILLVAPICLVQMLLAEPVVTLVFPGRWLPSVDVIRWLSAGMVTQPLYILAVALLMARGDYRSLGLAAGLAAAGVIVGAVLGSLTQSASQIAACVGASLFATNLAAGRIAFGRFGRGVLDLLHTIALPLALAAASAAAGWIAGRGLPAGAPLLEILLTGSVTFAVYWILLWYTMHAELAALASYMRVPDRLRRVRQRPSPDQLKHLST